MALPTTTNDFKLAILKARNYLGIAKIKLKAFNFNHPLMRKKHQLLFKKNIHCFKNVFKRTSYKRLKKKIFINAVVDNIALILLLAFLGLNKQCFCQL